MGMTIDLAKDILKHPTDYFPSEIDEANAYAIDTMRKYKQITEIVMSGDDTHYKLLMQIKEVVEDGRN